jgi:uncharacterized protein
MKSIVLAPMLALVAGLVSPVAKADLYSAQAAAQAKDFARAFELFGELAQLGHPVAQENLAVMYVNGEGVKRDNVLGYAWAVIAKEGGGGDASAGIIVQLDPHMNAAARARVAELQAQFGKVALQERLLPKIHAPGVVGKNRCGMRSVADPIAFYPADAKRRGISGTVLVEAKVAPDGRARNVRAIHSVPAGAFEEAGRRVALSSGYTPPVENGVPLSCTIRFKVNFSVREGSGGATASAEQQKLLGEAKVKATAGDPTSQLTYGLMLEMRSGMSADNDRPIDWFVKAAQAGIPTAQYLVGRHLLVAADAGLETDDSKGIAWLQLAANVGQADAQTLLANRMLSTNYGNSAGKAQDLLDKAAASGHRDGAFYLAGLLATGPDAARRDPRRALDLLEQVKDELDFDPSFHEVRAAALAMLGDFDEAQKDQKSALQRARKLGWDTRDLEARLAGYEASKTWEGNLFTL